MNLRNFIKKKSVIALISAIVAMFLVIAVINIIPTKQEKEFCLKLNSLAAKHLIKSIFLENGEKIDLDSLSSGFFRNVVFTLSEDDSKPAEVYAAKLKVSKSGAIKKVKRIVNLSATPDAEEGVYDVRNGWVAYATSMGANFQSVTTVRISGNYRKLFVFKPAVKKVQLEWSPSKIELNLEYKEKDKQKSVVLDPVKAAIAPSVPELKYFAEVNGSESWIASIVNFGRSIFGVEFVGNAEAVFFSLKDRVDSLTYSMGRYFSGNKSEYIEGAAEETLKNILPLINTEPLKGEGIWTTDGLPKGNNIKRPLLARTIIRPDPERPYALVDLLSMDAEQIEIAPVAGTIHPISTTGIKGKGIIPADDDTRERVIAAFSGGFQAVHGTYGMMIDGDVLLPPVKDIETLAMYADGSFKFGIWGEDITLTPSLVSYRQNLKPLIRKGIFNDKNRYWGLSADKNKSIYVWRTGFGITKDNRAIFAIGNSVSAYTLAKSMLAAGVEEAMHLDMNIVNVACEVYTPETDEKGGYKREKSGEIILKTSSLNSRIFGSSGRYLKPHTRDFLYISKRKQ